jgi:dTMP kinase
VIRPALEAGRAVVTDRFTGSSLAYQGYGHRLPVAEVAELSRFAAEEVVPAVSVLLAVPAEVAAARLTGRPDRLEALGDEFHRRVADGFAALAAESPDRWLVVDGVGDPDEVEARLWAALAARLGGDGRRHG